MNRYPLIGYACGNGAGDIGTHIGPETIEKSNLFAKIKNNFAWQETYKPKAICQKETALPYLAEINKNLANNTFKATSNKEKFLVIGGDHSSAIGTWSGASEALFGKGPLGLIWVDAHMDGHTFLTSETLNIHGMPFACLLGHGEPELTNILSSRPKILPENTCLIGIRSFEKAEQELLESLNIRIFYMKEIHERGLDKVMKEAFEIVNKNTAGFGISLDLDAFDPIDAPGVGTPVADGIKTSEFKPLLSKYCIKYWSRFVGTEIVEFNPYYDQENKTEETLVSMAEAMLVSKRFN